MGQPTSDVLPICLARPGPAFPRERLRPAGCPRRPAGDSRGVGGTPAPAPGTGALPGKTRPSHPRELGRIFQCLLVGGLLAFGLAPGLRAAAPDPAPGSLEATRDELARLPLLNLGLASGSAAPLIVLPEPVSPPPVVNPAPPRTGANDPLHPKKSPTWLLDAMAKPAPKPSDETARSRRDSRAPATAGAPETAEGAADGLPGAGAGSPEDPAATAQQETSRPAAKEAADKPDPPPNPLDGYMKGWMTSRDYALLQTVGSAAPNGGSGDLPAASPAPAATLAGAPASNPFTSNPGFVGDLGAPSATLTPPANPYLENSAPPPAPVTPLAGLPPADPPAAAPPGPVVSVPPATPPPPAAAPFVPPPATDSKYFPQLKKF